MPIHVPTPDKSGNYDAENERQFRRLVEDYLNNGGPLGMGGAAGGGGGGGGPAVGTVMHWRGDFNMLTTYFTGDVVVYQGGVYVVKTPGKGHRPPITPTDDKSFFYTLVDAPITLTVIVTATANSLSTENKCSIPGPSKSTNAIHDHCTEGPTDLGIIAGATADVTFAAVVKAGDLVLNMDGQFAWGNLCDDSGAALTDDGAHSLHLVVTPGTALQGYGVQCTIPALGSAFSSYFVVLAA